MGPLRIALLAVVIALPAPPVTAQEADACTYDASTKVATVAIPSVDEEIFIRLSVESGTILYQNQPCDSATTSNTDLVRVQGGGRPGVSLVIDETGGALEPGATPEPTGVSEIELEFDPIGFVTLTGIATDNVVRLGSLGVNHNGDDDADISFAKADAWFRYVGGPGVDDVSGAGGLGTGAMATRPFEAAGGDGDDLLVAGKAEFLAELAGDEGDDVLVAGPRGDALLGGVGKDRLLGGRGYDQLFGYAGDDVLRGGRSGDSLHGGGGDDRCVGGPGRDSVVKCEP